MKQLDHEMILKMLNEDRTIQDIVDVVNPGKKRQTMDEYIKRNFVCKKTWKEKRRK